jgi:peptidoglycan hydrolase CwlO-like protein
MKSAQTELTKELDDYKNEIELLSGQISDLQNELHEHGVSILVDLLNSCETFLN